LGYHSWRRDQGNKKIGTKWRIGGFLNSNGLSYEDRYVRVNDIIGYAAKLRDRILGDDASIDFNPETRDRLIGYGYEKGTFVHSKAKEVIQSIDVDDQ
jgi:hypothetical protein